MADDGATRTQRYRLHQRGDHSLCAEDRCAALSNPAPPRVQEGDLIADAVLELIVKLGLERGDARMVMLRLAATLAHELDEGRGGPSYSAEIRHLISDATMSIGEPEHAIDQIQARVAELKVDMLLQNAAKPSNGAATGDVASPV